MNSHRGLGHRAFNLSLKVCFLLALFHLSATELSSMVDKVICVVLDESIVPLKANLDALTEQADATTRDREAVRAAERHLAGLQIV